MNPCRRPVVGHTAARLSIAIALAALIVGADRPDLAQLAAWVACGVATFLLARAVIRG